MGNMKFWDYFVKSWNPDEKKRVGYKKNLDKFAEKRKQKRVRLEVVRNQRVIDALGIVISELEDLRVGLQNCAGYEDRKSYISLKLNGFISRSDNKTAGRLIDWKEQYAMQKLIHFFEDSIQIHSLNEGSDLETVIKDEISKDRAAQNSIRAGTQRVKDVAKLDTATDELRVFGVMHSLASRRFKTEKQRVPNSNTNEGVRTRNEKDLMYSLGWLQDHGFLHKDKGTRKKQLETLRPWISYLAGNYEDLNFIFLILREVFKYDSGWLDKHPDGNWKRGERDKKTKNGYPVFNANIMPRVLSRMWDLLNPMYNSPHGEGNWGAHLSSDLKDLARSGNIRELFYRIYQEIFRKSLTYDNFEGDPVSKEWLPVFSFKDCKSQEEKDVVARALMKATEDSPQLCIAEYAQAMNYLNRGDVYIYNVKYKLKPAAADLIGKEYVLIPELAVHTYLGSGNHEYLNEQEMHGNADNQGINQQFLPILTEFIKDKNFANAESVTEQRIADNNLYYDVKKKVEKGGQLTIRDLVFLHQLYREPGKLFELHTNGQLHVRNLLYRWGERLSREQGKKLSEEEVFEHDMRIVFGLSENQRVEFPTWSPSKKVAMYNEMSSKTGLIIGPITSSSLSGRLIGSEFGVDRITGLKAIVGNAVGYRKRQGEKFVFSNLEEITGYLSCNHENMSIQDYFLDREMFPKLRRISGIDLTEADLELIFSGKIGYFPQHDDPRFKRRFY